MPKKKDSRLERAGVSGYNKPKRTPSHPKKSHVVVAKVGDKVKTIRFGEQGASTAGKPKAGESARMKAKRKSFKARHAKNIAKGKMSAAYWADKVKWQTMAQLGSNEKPVLMTNKKNRGRVGKGSRLRPSTVSQEQFDSNWDKIFNKGK